LKKEQNGCRYYNNRDYHDHYDLSRCHLGRLSVLKIRQFQNPVNPGTPVQSRRQMLYTHSPSQFANHLHATNIELDWQIERATNSQDRIN
jgi:hypothetical protein